MERGNVEEGHTCNNGDNYRYHNRFSKIGVSFFSPCLLVSFYFFFSSSSRLFFFVLHFFFFSSPLYIREASRSSTKEPLLKKASKYQYIPMNSLYRVTMVIQHNIFSSSKKMRKMLAEVEVVGSIPGVPPFFF